MNTDQVVTLPPPVVTPAAVPGNKWEQEYQAFQKLLPQLLQTHRNQYVAIHENCVVDSDSNDTELILRVHKRFGYVPIHVERVTDQPLRPIRVPHYREYRPEGTA